jgi:hypothetical protein
MSEEPAAFIFHHEDGDSVFLQQIVTSLTDSTDQVHEGYNLELDKGKTSVNGRIPSPTENIFSVVLMLAQWS